MTSFIQTNKPFAFTISILAILLALSACSKKAAESAQDAKPAEAAAETPKAAEPAQDDKPVDAAVEAPKAQEPAQDDKPAEAAAAPQKAENSDADMTIDDIMANIKWEKGGVDRFLFEYEVPAFMEKQPAPDNHDGATYIWKEMTYKVWGANDMHDGSAKAAFDQAVGFLGHAPHYKVVKPNYYIISDFDEKSYIFYRKCVFNNALEYCEEITYPQAYKTAVNPIVKKIADFDVPKMEMEDSDFEYKYLAINPADCTVVCCKENEGCDTGFECNTKPIVDAGFHLGSTVYRVGYIMRGGSSCVYQGEQWEKCFLQKQEFEDYIKSKKLDCAPGEDKECLYENDECVPDD
ncbi:MAG: hypothetical protein IJM59_13910 [Proteobacteria bacterium]|nr:hypothetical protein [Pseudomonadota bacterium]